MIWVVSAVIFWLAAWALNVMLARSAFHDTRVVRIALPLLFGISLLVLWEGLVRGLGVSPVILPAPSVTWRRGSWPKPARFGRTLCKPC